MLLFYSDPTDSLSSLSLSIDSSKKPTMITSSTTITKPNIPLFQTISKENRSHTIAKCSPSDKVNANLRESLDELTQLSNRMDSVLDNEHHRYDENRLFLIRIRKFEYLFQ